jgi:hypothetical protein
MSLPNALTEALHQLFSGRQSRTADVLLNRCTRPALERLLASTEYVLEGRIRYAVEDKLRHRKPAQEDRTVPTMRALQHVLNTWCIEGRRAAIRAVLRELDTEELEELAHMPDLESEIASMTREFQF